MPLVSGQDLALVFISQVREKIGVMFGDKDEICGGNAPKFYASLILNVKRIGSEVEDGTRTANKTRVECKKNQIAPPFRKADVLIRYGKGFDKEASLLDLGQKHDLVQLKGSWYSMGGEKIGQGEKAACKTLRKNKALREKLDKAVRKKLTW
jgi:recombination protein RecA